MYSCCFVKVFKRLVKDGQSHLGIPESYFKTWARKSKKKKNVFLWLQQMWSGLSGSIPSSSVIGSH